MKSILELDSILYMLSGILFIIAGIIQKNYIFLPIGFCFFVLGINNNKNKNNK